METGSMANSFEGTGFGIRTSLRSFEEELADEMTPSGWNKSALQTTGSFQTQHRLTDLSLDASFRVLSLFKVTSGN